MSNLFNKYYRHYDDWYEKNKFAYLSELAAVKKFLPKHGRGLEIGVGTARFAAPLGIEYGIDPSGKMLDISRKRGIKAYLGEGEKLPFKRESFDYAVIIITICFVKDPLKVLNEAFRVLKKDGKIILGIIDGNSFLGLFYRKKKSVFYGQANFFSVGEASNLLRASGFDKLRYSQTIYDIPSRIKRVHRPAKGFGRGAFVLISAIKAARSNKDIYRKFRQYEKIRLLFKRHGYDMDEARRKVLKRAGRIIGPVLDCGTGPGRMAYTLAKSGLRVVSVDVSKQAQDVARIYSNGFKVSDKIKFINMDAQDLKFKDKSFHTAISANLLHDVRDPRKVIKEMIRVAMPGAKIIISDLNKKGRALVNKVYRLNKTIKKGGFFELSKVIKEISEERKIIFKKYNDGCIDTYIARIPGNNIKSRLI